MAEIIESNSSFIAPAKCSYREPNKRIPSLEHCSLYHNLICIPGKQIKVRLVEKPRFWSTDAPVRQEELLPLDCPLRNQD